MTAAPPLPHGLAIGRVRTRDGYRALEELQARIWGFEARGVVPAHVLSTVDASGGIVLVASVRDRPVGFVFGFLGVKEGRMYHVSHMLGVHPDFQGSGIGEALKWRQRETALQQGLDLMTWTFDPLEARNAYFNLHKLGATSRTYYENLYGDLGDRLNHSLPTDRLLVEWDLRRAAADRPTLAEAPLQVLLERDGEPALQLPPTLEGPALVAIPADIQALKAADHDRALRWRLALREALQRLFGQGYAVTDVAEGAYVATPRAAGSS